MLKLDARLGNDRSKWDDDFFSRLVRFHAEAAIFSNRVYLTDNPLTPRLYSSGVRYVNEPLGSVDQCVDIPIIVQRQWGDCLHLSCWRVAELRNQGEEGAAIHVRRQRFPHQYLRLFHVVVRRGGGEVEDPSRLLGM